MAVMKVFCGCMSTKDGTLSVLLLYLVRTFNIDKFDRQVYDRFHSLRLRDVVLNIANPGHRHFELEKKKSFP